MLWSIDSRQNRVSADQYHPTVSRAQMSTHRSRIFLKLSADNLLLFKWSQAQVCFLKIYINMSCLSHHGPVLLRFWLQTYLGHENSASYLKIQVGKTFSYHGTKWNTAAIKSLLLFMAGLFIGFLVEKCVTCQSRKSDFGWHRFRFSPCLIRKRSLKVSSDSGLTW